MVGNNFFLNFSSYFCLRTRAVDRHRGNVGRARARVAKAPARSAGYGSGFSTSGQYCKTKGQKGDRQQEELTTSGHREKNVPLNKYSVVWCLNTILLWTTNTYNTLYGKTHSRVHEKLL